MSERAPEAVLWDFLRGALTTRALALVAELGVEHEQHFVVVHVPDTLLPAV